MFKWTWFRQTLRTDILSAMNQPPEAPAQKQSLRGRIKLYLRQLAIRIVIYLFAYLAIAIVTIGPCFWHWYEATYVNGPRWIAKFYAPLVWLCDHCPPLSRLVNLYVRWWVL